MLYVEAEYWGESARSPYFRDQEHIRDLHDLKDSSHMARHLREKHPEVDPSNPMNKWQRNSLR